MFYRLRFAYSGLVLLFPIFYTEAEGENSKRVIYCEPSKSERINDRKINGFAGDLLRRDCASPIDTPTSREK